VCVGAKPSNGPSSATADDLDKLSGMRFWPRRKVDEGDVYRPLSEEEKEFVEHDVHEQSKYDEAPGSATPESPINVDDVHGLDLPLSEEQRQLAQREVDERLGRGARPPS